MTERHDGNWISNGRRALVKKRFSTVHSAPAGSAIRTQRAPAAFGTEIHLSPTLEHPALTQTEPNFIKATTAALQSSSLTRQSVWKGPKMQPYNEDEDSEHSLRTFERIPSGCQ